MLMIRIPVYFFFCTRHRDRVIIPYNKKKEELQKFASDTALTKDNLSSLESEVNRHFHIAVYLMNLFKDVGCPANYPAE